jgi:hypothetical protein
MVKTSGQLDLFSDCRQTIQSKITDLDEHDLELVNHLVLNIIRRWRQRSYQSKSPHKEYGKIFKDGNTNAKGAIVAIIELVQAIGKGDKVPKRYEDMIH